MNKIEDKLEEYFKKNYGDGNYKNLISNNMQILKDAFIAGYEQAIEDSEKLNFLTIKREKNETKQQANK